MNASQQTLVYCTRNLLVKITIQIGIQTYVRKEYDRNEVKNIHSLLMYMVINRYLLKNLQNQVNQTILRDLYRHKKGIMMYIYALI